MAFCLELVIIFQTNYIQVLDELIALSITEAG